MRARSSLPPGRLVLMLCAAEVLTMLSVFAFPTLIPTFRAAWGLTNADAGWISGVYFAGYALAVPVLMALTDRLDARRIYLGGAAVAAVSALGFALVAEGFLTALVLRFLGGVGLAGTYMPGLKALVDRYDGPRPSRAISLYTASFSLGTAASFYVVGEAGRLVGWQVAFAASAVAAVAAVALVAALPAVVPVAAPVATRLLDFRPVMRNRPAMGYVLGYVAHMWELFGWRSWTVAFLAAVYTRQEAPAGPSPTTMAALTAVVAMAASVGGADVCVRRDRGRVIMLYMVASAAMSFGLGFAAELPYAWVAALAVVYTGAVQLDSAALTTGAMHAAETGRRGATIAVHSLLGFVSAFLAPMAVGEILDRTGGGTSAVSWGWAFASLGAVGLLGPVALAWSRRPAAQCS